MKHIISLILIVCGLTLSAQKKSAELVADGLQKMEMGQVEEAIALYNQAIALDAENLDAVAKRAFAYNYTKQYAKAVEDYTAILAAQPNQAMALLSRGSAYSKLNEHQKAMNDFNQVLVIDPNNQEGYNNRGWAKKAMGDKEGACADWKTSKKLGNEEAKIILKNNEC